MCESRIYPFSAQKGPLKCLRVVLEMASQIPPEYEMLVTGKIHGWMDSADSWRVEGKPRSKVPLRLVKLSSKPVSVQPNTVIGQVEPVEEVKIEKDVDLKARPSYALSEEDG